MKFSIKKNILFLFTISTLILGCKDKVKEGDVQNDHNLVAPDGMVWVENKTFIQGAKEGDQYAMHREKPSHKVTVDGFYIDVTEVTNKQFKKFVDETGYITVAERPIDWEQMNTDLPVGTPKPQESSLDPGSVSFN
jgi:formylglycine-generating enzyme required for sulfatase activity